MKKAYKALSVLMVVLMIVCASTNVFAAFNISDINAATTTNADDPMKKMGSTILTVVTNAGMIIAVVVIAIIGVKYMVGSTEDKSEYKKSLMPYLIGAVLVFGASAIAKMVQGLGTSFLS